MDGGTDMADDARMTIGQRIREVMDRDGLTQMEVGRQITKDDGTAAGQGRINDWLHQRALPSRPYYKALAGFLGMSQADVSVLVGSERASRSRRGMSDRLDSLEAKVDALITTLEKLPRSR